jgi:hypothetical protein
MTELLHGDIYNPPPEEIELHKCLKVWAQSLVERHNESGLLSVLDYDPQTYPFQRIDVSLVSAYEPSNDELIQRGSAEAGEMTEPQPDWLMERGRQAIAEELLEESRRACSLVMGEEHYEKLVTDMIECRLRPDSNSLVLPTIWARIHTNGYSRNSAVLTKHNNLMDTAIVQKALVDAFSRAPFLKGSEQPHAGEFDIFSFAQQNFLIASVGMSHLAAGGIPVIELMSRTSNVSMLLPPKGARAVGVERRTILEYNRTAERQRLQATERLNQAGKSILDHIAPSGSTSKKIYDQTGKLLAIRAEPVSASAAKSIVNETHFLWPIILYLSAENDRPKAIVSNTRSVYGPAQFFEIIEEMSRATEELAGVRVYDMSEEDLANISGGLT